MGECEYLIAEITKCNKDYFKRYFLGVLDKAGALNFKDFCKVCVNAELVNSRWFNEWMEED
jgi:hypothetical protein